MSLSKSPEKFNFEELVKKYEDPLKSYSPHEVQSSQEAKEEFEKLTFNFQSKSDTVIQEQSLQHILELLKGGIQYYPGGDLKSFAPYIASIISDLRPTLVRLASLVVAAEAIFLEDDFIPSIDLIFPSLLKQISSSNQSIANSCHLSLLNIAKHCMNRKVARLFLNNATSNIPAYRQIAAECAHIIIETWPSQLASLLSKEATTVISTLLQDPIDTIRDIAISATKITRGSNTPTKSSKLVSTLPIIPILSYSKNEMSWPKRSPKSKLPTKRIDEPRSPKSRAASSISTSAIPSSPKAISPSPSSSPRSSQKGPLFQNKKPGEKKMSEFIPPTNSIQARQFKAHLDKIVSSDDSSSLQLLKGTIVESVLFSIKETPRFSEWKSDLNYIFDHYDELFKPYLVDIISLFGYQEQVIDFAVSKVGIQSLAESFTSESRTRNADAFSFFVSVFKLNKYQLNITEPISKLLHSLIKANPRNKDVECIKKVFQSEPTKEIQSILQGIIFKLSSDDISSSNWNSELEKLYSGFFGPDSNQYLQNLATAPNLILNENESVESIDSSSSNLASPSISITPVSKMATSFFSQNLPELITEGSEAQKKACLDFIAAASQKLNAVSFKACLQPIVNSLVEAKNDKVVVDDEEEEREVCTWYENAVECIARMMVDMDTLSESLILICGKDEKVSQILLESLHKFTVYATPQKIFAIHKVLARKLGPFLNGDNIAIRHNTINVFAECRKKIPKEFLIQMKKNFTPTQIRLIELKAGKYRKKNANK